ncbi:nonribosomal peptide synthase [Aspergillus tubingensis]|nr:nonribosomal peptide synthase [Aspergillus tubingensis]
MPPIAGVANGAMIMEDVQFDHVEFESMERSMKPKVLGSKLLDEAFYDTALDFFIMFSSIAGVVGNTGQSTYAAANMYMAGLALNRRKRGVVGSVIAYSPLMGLGYIDRTDETMGDKFLSMGVSLMSETDFRYAFAEAIKEGQASCHDRAELITGCAPKVLSDITRNRYRSDIRFSHINLERINGQAGAGAGDSSIRGLLKQAGSMEEVEGVVLDAFTARLKTLLRMSTEQPLDANSSLVGQGIDSLVAIDIREWFDRELEIDMPVIKILGGSSIVALVKGCLQDIPETVVDIRNLSNEDQSVGGKPAAPAAATSGVESAIPLSDSKDSISSSSDSESVDTSSHYGTSDTEPEEENTCEPSIDLDLRQSIIQSATEKVVPMSFSQARFWFMQHALQDPSALNMGRCWHIEGALDLPRLRKAVITVADRHEAMRTRFFWGGQDHDVPMQGILSRSIVQLETKRITNKEEVNRELDAMRYHAYDLGDWQLVRTRLLTLSNREHYMIIGNHPITFDDSSASLLLNEMNQAYLGQSLPSLPQEAQYSFFAEAQFRDYKEGRFQKHIDYFKALIKEENHPLELFAFSKAPVRPVQTQYRTHRSDMRLSSKQASLLKQISQDRHSATSDLYTAVLGALLFRLLPNTNQVLLGIDADRNDLALGRSMGCAHNALPVRLERPGINTKLGPYLDTVRNSIEGVLEHSAVPFDVLVNELKLDRSANVPPVFQAMIQHRVERQDQVTWCNATCNPDKSLNSCTGLDLYLDITENCTGETAVGLEVQQGLYSQEHADLLVKSFVYLLEQLTTNLDVPLATSELWPPEDISRALELGTGPVAPMQWPRTVVHRIDQMIQQNGSNLALKDGSGKSLTYNDMGRRIDSIIAALRQAGTPKGSVIGMMQEPSVDSICSMLAVFRAGAVYMPFDHRISIDRAQGAIHKAKPLLLLVDQSTVDKAKSLQGPMPRVLDISSVATRQHIPRTPNLADGSSPAIILSTGGSTFEPSLVKHASIIPQLEASSMQYNFSNERPLVALQHSANSTDLSLTQTLDVLCNGGSLIILPANRQGDPVEIAKTMQEEKISYTLAAPSEYQNWLSCAAEQLRNCPRWTLAITTGEGVPQKLLQSFRTLDSPSLQLLNLYSPVGTCFGSTWQGLVEYRKSDAKSPVAAGYASPNQAIYIVDVELRPLPVGVPGEVLIGGAGIADCYGNMDSTMKERFIESPFSQLDSNFTTNKWETVYRTGDRGYLQKDGALILVGRSDGATQVNVRGFQVDLEEVENALIEASGGFLTNAAVTLREHGEDQFLAAHVVFSNQKSQKNSQEMLLDNLLMRLTVPDYMVPSAIVVLEELPLDSHSKVDRTAICQLPIDESNVVTPTSREMTSMEASLAKVWKGVLSASASPTLTPSSDFFQAGGTSLLIMILQRAIKEQYKVALPVTELVATKRLADMARLIEGKGVFV